MIVKQYLPEGRVVWEPEEGSEGEYEAVMCQAGTVDDIGPRTPYVTLADYQALEAELEAAIKALASLTKTVETALAMFKA